MQAEVIVGATHISPFLLELGRDFIWRDSIVTFESNRYSQVELMPHNLARRLVAQMTDLIMSLPPLDTLLPGW